MYSHTHTHTHIHAHLPSFPFMYMSPSPPDIPQFFLVGIHTKPSEAFSEINALVDVYDEAVNHYGTENGIILGDFNADCSYLSQRHYNMLQLFTDSRFTWLLDTDVDSTTGNSDCAYDRLTSVAVCVGQCLQVLFSAFACCESLKGWGEDGIVLLFVQLNLSLVGY